MFKPSAYVKSEFQKRYEELSGGKIKTFKQADREHYLIGMMKVNYLKRLESSIESFEISLDRTIQKIENLEQKINDFLKSKLTVQKEYILDMAPDDDELEENEDELIGWQVGKN